MGGRRAAFDRSKVMLSRRNILTATAAGMALSGAAARAATFGKSG
jgi:hypothetical protein